jgi:hypothetical protein
MSPLLAKERSPTGSAIDTVAPASARRALKWNKRQLLAIMLFDMVGHSAMTLPVRFQLSV